MSALHDELTNDPESMGYAPLLAAGSHNQVAALLNEPRYDALGSVLITPCWSGLQRMALWRACAQQQPAAMRRWPVSQRWR